MTFTIKPNKTKRLYREHGANYAQNAQKKTNWKCSKTLAIWHE